jgi:prolyl-tRNA editing enzyme YbaK/EbsC (Cys-tRNA(Pro) deacylase)
MHPNCAAVNEILQAAGVTGRVRLLDEAVTTARAAAEHLGCPVGAIANSLIFETFNMATAGAPLLIMTSGAHRVDMSKVGEQLGYQLRRASPAFVRDRTLAEFDELWAAGGIPHAVFPLTYDELLRLTGGVEADVG